jgi:hypothetical protein
LADEEFKDVAMDSPQADIERFKQHLRTMLRTAQQRARLVGKLPPSVITRHHLHTGAIGSGAD